MDSREKAAGVVAKRPWHKAASSAYAVMGVEDKREKEIAANLERVDEDISALMSMARDIGMEVDIQNDQIYTIAEQVRCHRFHREHHILTRLPSTNSI